MWGAPWYTFSRQTVNRMHIQSLTETVSLTLPQVVAPVHPLRLAHLAAGHLERLVAQHRVAHVGRLAKLQGVVAEGHPDLDPLALVGVQQV